MWREKSSLHFIWREEKTSPKLCVDVIDGRRQTESKKKVKHLSRIVFECQILLNPPEYLRDYVTLPEEFWFIVGKYLDD